MDAVTYQQGSAEIRDTDDVVLSMMGERGQDNTVIAVFRMSTQQFEEFTNHCVMTMIAVNDDRIDKAQVAVTEGLGGWTSDNG